MFIYKQGLKHKLSRRFQLFFFWLEDSFPLEMVPFQVACFFWGEGGTTSQFGNFHIQNSWQPFSVRAWKLPTLGRDVFETHLIHGETISW